MLKKCLVLVALLVLVSSAQATNYFPSGDMENGGDATTPPLYWTGSDGVAGLIGVSSDTPTGTGQSLRVETYGGATTVNSVDYGGGGTFDGTEKILLAYDAKGDVYTATSGMPGGGTISVQGDDWLHYSAWVTPPAGPGAFSFRVYDNSAFGSPGDRAAYLDNVYVGDDYTYQDFGSNNNVYNGDVDTHPDGAYWYIPGGGVSNDTAVPGGTYSIGLGVDSYANLATRNMVENTMYTVTLWHKGTVDVWVNETDSAAGVTLAGSSEWQMSSFITTTDPGASAGPYMYFSDAVVGGDNVLVDNVTIVEVPEPATMVMIGLGGVAVLLRRRRK